MSQLTRLRDFLFNPAAAALARGTTSANPVVVAASTAGLAAVAAATSDVETTLSQPLTANSATALGSALIKDAEDGLRAALDGMITAALASIPIVGPMATPEAVGAANMMLAFGEQHALTYVSALFGHGRTLANTAPQSQAAAQQAQLPA